MPKTIQSDGFIGALLGKLAGPLIKVAAPLAKYILAPFATMALTSERYGAIQRKMLGNGVLRARKGIILAILNEDMDDITIIIKSQVKQKNMK